MHKVCKDVMLHFIHRVLYNWYVKLVMLYMKFVRKNTYSATLAVGRCINFNGWKMYTYLTLAIGQMYTYSTLAVGRCTLNQL
jgi:hypothetical protein